MATCRLGYFLEYALGYLKGGHDKNLEAVHDYNTIYGLIDTGTTD